MLSCNASFGATLPTPRHSQGRRPWLFQGARSALVDVLDCHGAARLAMTGWRVKNPPATRPAETSLHSAETSLHPAETSLRPAEISPHLAETSPHLAETSPRPVEVSLHRVEISPHSVEVSPHPAQITYFYLPKGVFPCHTTGYRITVKNKSP
jgi:hypothetical protein